MFYNYDKKSKLYHSMRVEHLSGVLEDNHLKARTTQRYFPKGRALKDDDPNYESDSRVMIGWSMTRDPFFAACWKDVLMVFDEAEIRKRFKVQQIAWNYTIRGDSVNDYKKEAESFIIATKTGKTWDQIKKEYSDLEDRAWDLSGCGDNSLLETLRENGINNFIDYIKSGQPKILPLKYCKEIYVSDESIKVLDSEVMKKLDKSGLYKGTYNEKELREKKESEEISRSKILNHINFKKRII